MYLISVYLPLSDNNGARHSGDLFANAERQFSEKFGGLTAYMRAPADGFWKDGSREVSRDEIVVFEIISEDVDRAWWESVRADLASQFMQKEILVIYHEIARL